MITLVPAANSADNIGAGINNSGQIVGQDSASQRAFLWTPGVGIQSLGTLGGLESHANAINDSDLVVGGSETASSNVAHAFFWTQADGMQAIDFGPIYSSEALAVNNSGQVVGYFQTDINADPHAFLWTKATGVQDLGRWIATAINDSSQVAGSSARHVGRNGTDGDAVLWTTGSSLEDLGNLFGSGRVTSATSINNTGEVAGYSCEPFAPPIVCHAFVWTRTTGMQDLGVLPKGYSNFSWASSINDSGRVVGFSEGTNGDAGFLWSGAHGLQNLNNLGGNSKLTHRVARGEAINRAGQIATRNEFGSYVLLTPKMFTTLTSSPNPSNFGQPVTFTADVNSPIQGPPPDGEMVKFATNGTVLAQAPLSEGIAIFSTSTLTVGSHPVVATYAGDQTYASSKSKAVFQTVQ